ncbi:hypothetical protein ACIGDI_33920 [Streptomyces sp. NPDC085900]|uniref:hypothetical protein n=1 Tax=Streptomyces sp. NPDC085900 TaxID=3365737 RepID=UPI0037D19380
MPRRLGPVPSTHYEHLTSDSAYGSSRIRVSQPHPINLERPATGAHRATLACATCGDPVEITVLSLAATKLWRLGWLLASALSLILVVTCVLGVKSTVPDGGALPLFTLGLLSGILLSVYAILHWRHEDGVRGPGLPWRSGRHYVRHFWAGPR